MINFYEVVETNQMIEEENLDVRTITLGISLMDCIDSDLDRLNEKIYKKITTLAKDLVSTGEKIESEFGIPIVNKRISITPVPPLYECAHTSVPAPAGPSALEPGRADFPPGQHSAPSPECLSAQFCQWSLGFSSLRSSARPRR